METTLIIAMIGTALTFITCVGGLIVRDRAVLAIIAAGDKAVRDEISTELKTLHERINKTRDEFVRRDDLDTHLKSIEQSISRMYDEQRQTNHRLDGFMTAMAKNGTGHQN